MKQNIVILTGAGISAESGIKTFRDADGLWEGHDIMEVASPMGWQKNKELVLDFYNKRRKQLQEVEPNAAHLSLAKLEEKYNTTIVTQNVDDLHERAGSTEVIHLHGELKKVRSTSNVSLVYPWEGDLLSSDKAEDGSSLRPDIVWFGEAVPMMEQAVFFVRKADIMLIIGTSMQVYPAAGLVAYADRAEQIYYIDPKPHINHELSLTKELVIIDKKATDGVPTLVDKLLR